MKKCFCLLSLALLISGLLAGCQHSQSSSTSHPIAPSSPPPSTTHPQSPISQPDPTDQQNSTDSQALTSQQIAAAEAAADVMATKDGVDNDYVDGNDIDVDVDSSNASTVDNPNNTNLDDEDVDVELITEAEYNALMRPLYFTMDEYYDSPAITPPDDGIMHPRSQIWLKLSAYNTEGTPMTKLIINPNSIPNTDPNPDDFWVDDDCFDVLAYFYAWGAQDLGLLPVEYYENISGCTAHFGLSSIGVYFTSPYRSSDPGGIGMSAVIDDASHTHYNVNTGQSTAQPDEPMVCGNPIFRDETRVSRRYIDYLITITPIIARYNQTNNTTCPFSGTGISHLHLELNSTQAITD